MKTWLISGASGLLGHALCKYLKAQGQHVIGLYNQHYLAIEGVKLFKVNLLSEKIYLEKLILEKKPDVIFHAAGITNVDWCEAHEDIALGIHSDIAFIMARAAREIGAKMVYISTDHLWDGTNKLISENLLPCPINAYARTKLAGELNAQEANPDSLIIRTNFYGPGLPWRQSFSDWVVSSLSSGENITAFIDVFYTPLCLEYLCGIIGDLVSQDTKGIFNIVGRDRLSKFEFVMRLSDYLGLDSSLVNPGYLQSANLSARRPLDMSLSAQKIEQFLGRKMPTLDECLNTLDFYRNNSVFS